MSKLDPIVSWSLAGSKAAGGGSRGLSPGAAPEGPIRTGRDPSPLAPLDNFSAYVKGQKAGAVKAKKTSAYRRAAFAASKSSAIVKQKSMYELADEWQAVDWAEHKRRET